METLQKIIDEKKRLHDMSQISLWLFDYEDIFSDFDPRPYEDRSLSDDFLIEAKKASVKKASGAEELNLYLPSNNRDKKTENIVIKRLRKHFSNNYKTKLAERKKMIQQGITFILLGTVLMLITTLIHYYEEGLLLSFLIVLFEPASWFLLWEGLNIVMLKTKEQNPELTFYEAMAQCEIHFKSY